MDCTASLEDGTSPNSAEGVRSVRRPYAVGVHIRIAKLDFADNYLHFRDQVHRVVSHS